MNLVDIAVVVEGDLEDRLLANLGREESHGRGGAAEVIPGIFVEGPGERGRAQGGLHGFAIVDPWNQVGDDILVGQIPPGVEPVEAAAKRGGEDRQP